MIKLKDILKEVANADINQIASTLEFIAGIVTGKQIGRAHV